MDELLENLEIPEEHLTEEEINEILGIEEDVPATDEDRADKEDTGDEEDIDDSPKVSFKKKVRKKPARQEKKNGTDEATEWEEDIVDPPNPGNGIEKEPKEGGVKKEDEGHDEAPVPKAFEEGKGYKEKALPFDNENKKTDAAKSSTAPIDIDGRHAYEDYSEQVGSLAVRAAGTEDDSTLSQGIREMKNSEMLFIAKVLAQDTGGAALYREIRVGDERLKDACVRTEALIKEGKLTLSDLESGKTLSRKLKDVTDGKGAHLSATEAAEIEKSREEIIRKFRIKSELLSKEGLLTGSEKEWISSERFYKSSSSPRLGAILDRYFLREDTPFSKDTKISTLRHEDVKKLIKKHEEGSFTRQIHADLLKDYEKRLKKRELRLRIYGRGIAPRKPARLIGHLTTLSMSSNSDIGHFVHETRIFLTSADIAKRAFSVSDGYIRKHSVIGRGTKKLFEASKRHMFETAKKTRFVQGAATAGRTLYFTAKQTVRFAKNKAGKALHIKTVKRHIKTAANTAFNTKPARFAKAVAKKSAKTAKTVRTSYRKATHVISTPIRAIGKVTDLIRRINLKVLGVIGGTLLALFKFYNVLLFVVMLLLSIDSLITSAKESGESMVSTYVDMLRSVINYEDYSDMQSDIDYMTARDRQRYEKVREIGEGKPENEYVTNGETIDHYGSPDNPKGYTLTLTDQRGIELPEGTTNARDIEALCIAMISNDLGMYKGYSRDKRMLDDLIADMYDLLAENITVNETDIYFCSHGCADFYYHCNSADDYNDYYYIYANGGACYTELLPLKDEDYGCRSYPRYDYSEHRYKSEYYCPGDHRARVCFGHRDADITVTLYGIEYAISNNIYPRNWKSRSYAPMIKEFAERGAWTNKQFCEYARRYYGGDWKELYGISLLGGIGYATTDPMSDAEIEEIMALLPKDLSKDRKEIVAFALSAVGKVGYQWGGKATGTGWNASFGSSTPDEKGRANGLDCSGFVQWVYRSAIGKYIPGSTAGFSGKPGVSKESLEIGDLGFYKIPGSEENHIGIYAGRDETGNDMWIHCAGATGSTYGTGNFKYYLKMID